MVASNSHNNRIDKLISKYLYRTALLLCCRGRCWAYYKYVHLSFMNNFRNQIPAADPTGVLYALLKSSGIITTRFPVNRPTQMHHSTLFEPNMWQEHSFHCHTASCDSLRQIMELCREVVNIEWWIWYFKVYLPNPWRSFQFGILNFILKCALQWNLPKIHVNIQHLIQTKRHTTVSRWGGWAATGGVLIHEVPWILWCGRGLILIVEGVWRGSYRWAEKVTNRGWKDWKSISGSRWISLTEWTSRGDIARDIFAVCGLKRETMVLLCEFKEIKENEGKVTGEKWVRKD